jgi:hypothetical protein
MAFYTWPPLPFKQSIQLNYRDRQNDNTIRTEFDAGVDQVRALYSGVPRIISNAQMALSLADKTTLGDFYKLVGAARFDWIDPDDLSACECRFLSPPEFDRISPTHFMATFTFEILP